MSTSPASTAEVLYRARAYDTPDDPFADAPAPGFRYDDDLGIAVDGDGVIVARGPFADVAARHPQPVVLDLRGGILLPGLVDTHVHFPQVRVIGSIGLPLLEWLDRCALPEECRLAEGHDSTVVDRIACPIGDPTVRGKEPAVVALSVAVELLRQAVPVVS